MKPFNLTPEQLDTIECILTAAALHSVKVPEGQLYSLQNAFLTGSYTASMLKNGSGWNADIHWVAVSNMSYNTCLRKGSPERLINNAVCYAIMALECEGKYDEAKWNFRESTELQRLWRLCNQCLTKFR